MRLRILAATLAAALLVGCASGQTAAEVDTAPILVNTAPAEGPSPTAAQATAADATAAPTEGLSPTAEGPSPTAAPAEGPSPTAAPAEDLSPTPAQATAAPAANLAGLSVDVELLVEGFAQPTSITSAGDGSGRLFVSEQAGRIWVVREGARLAQPFLDIEELVGSDGNEQGLLSVAFHPRYAENGRLFVNYTDRAGTTVVARYTAQADNPDLADPASAAVLLTVEQPAANHNGGLMKFGPDGFLYIGLGDGGAAGDPWGNGQNLATLLGKMLRIDVDGAEPYTIPADNPFVGQGDARPEIWAYGLRNPWRFSFDRATGDLYIGDVGQNEQEEINFQPATSRGGENYGWDIMEGTACYDAGSCDQGGLSLPVATYEHASEQGGCSVTGGYVYRGAAFPQLAGVYLYADYCTGNLWGMQPANLAQANTLLTTLDLRITSFGEDEAGELYVADRDGGGIYRVVAGQ